MRDELASSAPLRLMPNEGDAQTLEARPRGECSMTDSLVGRASARRWFHGRILGGLKQSVARPSLRLGGFTASATPHVSSRAAA